MLFTQGIDIIAGLSYSVENNTLKSDATVIKYSSNNINCHISISTNIWLLDTFDPIHMGQILTLMQESQ